MASLPVDIFKFRESQCVVVSSMPLARFGARYESPLNDFVAGAAMDLERQKSVSSLQRGKSFGMRWKKVGFDDVRA